jgi:hypothetical protein
VPVADRPALDGGERWDEIILAGARLRFRLDRPASDGPTDPRLIRLVNGDVLTSVSRRHPIRPQVAVWTATNRVFGCEDPHLLAAIAAALAEDRCVLTAVRTHLRRDPAVGERLAITGAVAQLRELVAAEAYRGRWRGHGH